RLIVDHYRRRSSDKRGGDEPLISLDDVDIPVPGSFTSWLDLDAALEGLERVDPVAAEVVQLRYIGGMSLEDTANALGIGSATVGRKWRFARTWLARWLAD
ncbi:MAG: ECF-type sigma factor, partial [Pseudomonadota bacterium]